MSNPLRLESVFMAIRDGKKAEELELYRLIFQQRSRFLGTDPLLSGEVETVFPEAFFVLKEKIRIGKLKVPDGKTQQELEKWLCNIFQGLLLRQMYTFENNTWLVVEGVRCENSIAKEKLSKALNESGYINYARKLMFQFNVQELEAEDFVNDAMRFLLEKIKKNEFTLSSEDSNEINRNRLLKFFRQTIFQKIRKWKQKQHPSIAIERIVEPTTQQSEENLISVQTPQFWQWKLFNLIDQQGEPCRMILKETYFSQKTPRQIALALNIPQYADGEAVEAQKIRCINKLHSDLMYMIKDSNDDMIFQLEKLSFHYLEQLKEPCKSILHYALPPENKNMEEIAKILQKNRPLEEVVNLKTSDQVKRRKYKCLQGFYDDLWGGLIQYKK